MPVLSASEVSAIQHILATHPLLLQVSVRLNSSCAHTCMGDPAVDSLPAAAAVNNTGGAPPPLPPGNDAVTMLLSAPGAPRPAAVTTVPALCVSVVAVVDAWRAASA
jgi:hypothetical protein